MIDLDVTNESSASWDKLSFRKSSVERLGTRTAFSSSDDSLYCTVLLAFLGLDRVALVVVDGRKSGSSGLGLRRRAMVADGIAQMVEIVELCSQFAHSWPKKSTRPRVVEMWLSARMFVWRWLLG